MMQFLLLAYDGVKKDYLIHHILEILRMKCCYVLNIQCLFVAYDGVEVVWKNVLLLIRIVGHHFIM
jgi:hypothetical protein